MHFFPGLGVAADRGSFRRVPLVRAVAAACLVLAVAACDGQPRNFPGALDQQTDTTVDKAFAHYGLALPAAAKNMRYSAWSGDDMYPVTAIFRIDCQEVPDFVSRSHLAPVASDMDLEGAGVDLDHVARQYGWVASKGKNNWYERKFATYQTIDTLIQQVAGTCTVYVSV
jgi:hypothetical protein